MSRKKSLLGCAEFQQNVGLSRRGFLKAGALGVGGLSLADLFRLEAQGAPIHQDRSVIILWMRGGPSQHETWDPKPLAPSDYRGAFGATSTNVPGIQIVDLLPNCAKIMDKWSIIRSLHHTNAGHSAGDQILFTGHLPGTDPTRRCPSASRLTSWLRAFRSPSTGAIATVCMIYRHPKRNSFLHESLQADWLPSVMQFPVVLGNK